MDPTVRSSGGLAACVGTHPRSHPAGVATIIGPKTRLGAKSMPADAAADTAADTVVRSWWQPRVRPAYPRRRMSRRIVVLLELLVLTALLLWVSYSLYARPDRPANAIDLKVQLAGATDRVWLLRRANKELAYQLLTDAGETVLLSPEQFSRRLYDDQSSRGFWAILLNVSSPAGFAWVFLGFFGQVLFTGRMLVQWLHSERHRRSVVPPSFWWMSLVGASMLLIYFIWRKEPIGVLGQATGWFIYVRNLWLIHRPPAPVAAATAK